MMLNKIEQTINLIEDDRELDQVIQFVKNRRRSLGNILKYSLTIGDKVIVENSGNIEKGEITKINRTRAVVSMRGGSWTVPFSMIKLQENNNDR